MPVPAPADKRFRRARVSPRRRGGWRRGVWRVAIVVSALAGASYTYSVLFDLAAGSPALTVKRIAIGGNSRMSDREIRSMLDGLEGSNLVATDLDVWRRRLLASPWIADADIRRVFPDGVSVVVRERQAAALGRVDGVLYLIDHGATIIAALGPGDVVDLPIVDGLATGRSGALLVDERRARLTGRLLGALRPHPELSARVSQIDVTDLGNAVVILNDDTALVRLGDERFAERLQTYVDVRPRLRESMPDIDWVDLRYGSRVYAGPLETPSGGGPRGRRG